MMDGQPGFSRSKRGSATVRYKSAPGDDESRVVPLAEADVEALAAAFPWREFRWRAGQRHYSGTYWAATGERHVIYESRLELARLLFADFDSSVHQICAQPFLLTTRIDGVERRHIPDFLLMTQRGPTVVDVKPAQRLTHPKVAATFAWTREELHSRGWIYEVWSEPNGTQLHNIRFLAGFRHRALFDPMLLADLRDEDPAGASIADVVARHRRWPSALVRSALFHLIWDGEFVVDLDHQLQPHSTLTRKV